MEELLRDSNFTKCYKNRSIHALEQKYNKIYGHLKNWKTQTQKLNILNNICKCMLRFLERILHAEV